MRFLLSVSRTACLLAAVLALSACGFRHHDEASAPGTSATPSQVVDGSPSVAAPTKAPLNLQLAVDIKAFRFTWDVVEGASYYQVLMDSDGSGPELPTPVGDAVLALKVAGTMSTTITPPAELHGLLNASFSVKACNDAGCGNASTHVQGDVLETMGYFKASNANAGDAFGFAVALSRDGGTLAAVATQVDAQATATTVGTSGVARGAVYVFNRVDGQWTQTAFIQLPSSASAMGVGTNLKLSGNGTTLALTIPRPNIGGQVVVYRKAAGQWSEGTVVTMPDVTAVSLAVNNLALSDDGNSFVVGMPFHSSMLGMATVFRMGANGWMQETLPGLPQTAQSVVGYGVAMSGDGRAVAVASPGAGSVHVYTLTDTGWSSPETVIDTTAASSPMVFGLSVALSADGSTMAVGGNFDILPAPSSTTVGVAHVFTRSGKAWTQATIRPMAGVAGLRFGQGVALSSDGATLLIGAPGDGSSSRMGDAMMDPTDTTSPYSGALYLYKLRAGSWTEAAYLKSGKTVPTTALGHIVLPGVLAMSSIALSGDGTTIAAGDPFEASQLSGISRFPVNGNTLANSSGAVYLY